MDKPFHLHCGDCLEWMETLPSGSISAVITDPPYGLAFMGKAWDRSVPGPEFFAEMLRVAKPGAHLLSFGGTRTYHRMACAIEDAGWEVRDMLQWLYGSGFPKSMDVSKAIDKAAGAEREVVGTYRAATQSGVTGGLNASAANERGQTFANVTIPATDAARQWNGWGTALKPAHEILTLAQKPLDLQALCASLAQTVWSQLCQFKSPAKRVELSSLSSQSASAVVADSVLWSAVGACNTPGDLFALMDTLPSGTVIPSSLNTAFSWLNILAEVCSRESMFTTSTATGLTTDLRILNCCLSKNTQEGTGQSATPLLGIGQNALLAESLFSVVALKAGITRTPFAAALATSLGNEAGLRPDCSAICLARKPLIGTVAANVLAHGTGALNVDGCRLACDGGSPAADRRKSGRGGNGVWPDRRTQETYSTPRPSEALGRWPANLLLDESAAALLDEQSGESESKATPRNNAGRPASVAKGAEYDHTTLGHADSGGASRFFYVSKASTAEREEGLEDFEAAQMDESRDPDAPGGNNQRNRGAGVRKNIHATVKPVDLMRWLCRLITPPGGIVLDPFTGSGTTGVACAAEGLRFMGAELSPEYHAIAERRISRAYAQRRMF